MGGAEGSDFSYECRRNFASRHEKHRLP